MNFTNILDKIKWLSYALNKSWCDMFNVMGHKQTGYPI